MSIYNFRIYITSKLIYSSVKVTHFFLGYLGASFLACQDMRDQCSYLQIFGSFKRNRTHDLCGTGVALANESSEAIKPTLKINFEKCTR